MPAGQGGDEQKARPRRETKQRAKKCTVCKVRDLWTAKEAAAALSAALTHCAAKEKDEHGGGIYYAFGYLSSAAKHVASELRGVCWVCCDEQGATTDAQGGTR